MVEHLIEAQGVGSSNLSSRTKCGNGGMVVTLVSETSPNYGVRVRVSLPAQEVKKTLSKGGS